MEKQGMFARWFGEAEKPEPVYKKANISPMTKPKKTEHVRQANALSKMLEEITVAEKQLADREIEFRSSNEQIKNFKAFVRNAEVEMQNSLRIAEERDAFSEAVTNLSQDRTELKVSLEEARSNLAAMRTENDKLRSALENARADIIRLMQRDSEYQEEIETIANDLARIDTERGKLASKVEILSAEKNVFVERAEKFQQELRIAEQKLTDIQKNYEAMDDERNAALELYENASSDASSALKSLEKYQEENAQFRSQLSNVTLELNAQKKQSAEQIKLREEETYALRAKVSTLQSQARVKEQVLHQARDDLSLARSEVNASKEITQQLRQAVDKQKEKADLYEVQAVEANAQANTMSVKYDGVLMELEAAQKELQRLTRALKYEAQKMEFVFDTSASEQAAKSLSSKSEGASKGKRKPH